jgi:hypothetical protein
MHPPHEGILTGEAQLLQIVPVQIERGVQPLDRFARGRDELLASFGVLVEGLLECGLLPALKRLLEIVAFHAASRCSHDDVPL